MKALVYLIVVLIGLSCGVVFWHITKTWSYNLSYKSMVKKTIVEMVKEEALKNPPKAK